MILLFQAGEVKVDGVVLLGLVAGVGQDEIRLQRALALEQYEKAALCGSIHARTDLGTIYLYGNGVKADYAKALEWLTFAAEKGDARAQFELGSMYYNGTGIKADRFKALHWYKKAARQGDSRAQAEVDALETAVKPY